MRLAQRKQRNDVVSAEFEALEKSRWAGSKRTTAAGTTRVEAKKLTAEQLGLKQWGG